MWIMLLLQEQRPAVNFVEDALQKSVATCGGATCFRISALSCVLFITLIMIQYIYLVIFL